MYARRPAPSNWEASRAELDRTHERIASLTAGLYLPAHAPAWQPKPSRRVSSALVVDEAEWEPGSTKDAEVPAKSTDSDETENAAFWRRESQRMADEVKKLKTDLQVCQAARDAALRRADEAAIAAESAARACDEMKSLADASTGDGSHMLLNRSEASAIRRPVGAAAELWARQMKNLKLRVLLACMRDAWQVWAVKARRAYQWRVQNGTLCGSSAARIANASKLTASRQGEASTMLPDGHRPKYMPLHVTLAAAPTTVEESGSIKDKKDAISTSPRWEAKRPAGDDWRPYGARTAETLSSTEHEHVRSAEEVGVLPVPPPPSPAPVMHEISALSQRRFTQRTATITPVDSRHSGLEHRRVLSLGKSFQQHALATPGELSQTQQWALLHPTHSKDVALALTAAEHSEMLGAAERRAEQHLVDVRRRLRTTSD
jgi:hypothetical protein